MKPYVFILQTKFGLTIYKGYHELPEIVVNHEFSPRKMRDILSQYGYKQQAYYQG